MKSAVMKIPTNGATRLSTETWIEGEAWRRYTGAASVRKAIEQLVSDASTKAMTNPDFIKVLQEVRAEGVEGNKR